MKRNKVLLACLAAPDMDPTALKSHGYNDRGGGGGLGISL